MSLNSSLFALQKIGMEHMVWNNLFRFLYTACTVTTFGCSAYTQVLLHMLIIVFIGCSSFSRMTSIVQCVRAY